MHTVGKFIYDPNRLIFYRAGYNAQTIEKICKSIETNDYYEILREKLNAYNADEIQIKPGALHRAGICLTDNCNFRCNYCSGASVDGHKETLSVEDIMAFVDDVMKRWTINKLLNKEEEPLSLTFTGGGEPTYDWELFSNTVTIIRQKCAENNIPLNLSITTNGLLNQSQLDFISKNYNSVMVSYDGMPEIQDKNRRTGRGASTSESVENTIRFLAKKQVNLTIRTTIWQSDFCRLREMADYIFKNFGVSIEWSILPVIPTGRALTRVCKEQQQLRESDFLTPFVDVIEYAKNKFDSANISTPLFNGLVNAFFCGGISVFCSCPWLLPNKEIITCMEASDVKTVIGKIENKEVVYYEKCVDPLFKMYQKKFDECRECIAYRFCKGGCPARQLMNKDIKTTMDDWECAMIQKYITYIFKNILDGKECFGWRAAPVEISDLKDVEVLKLTKS